MIEDLQGASNVIIKQDFIWRGRQYKKGEIALLPNEVIAMLGDIVEVITTIHFPYQNRMIRSEETA